MTPITYEYNGGLYINMTNACTNACDFCLRNNSDGSLYAKNLWYQGGEPSKEEMLEDIKKRNLTEYKEIVFCGYGEPTCRFDDMMWLAGKIRELAEIEIRVNTNGQSDLIMGRNTAPDFDGKFDCVSISLNSSTPEGYDEVCHSVYGLEALPAILKFTENLKKYVPKVIMTVVSTMETSEIEACKALCLSTGAEFRVREYISK